MSGFKRKNVYPDKDWSWLNDNNTVRTRKVRIPQGLFFLWSTIYQLKVRYNIATLEGRVGLVAWWLLNGVKEYPALNITIEDDKALYEPADIASQDNDYPLSRIVLSTAQLNTVLMKSIDLGRREDKIQLINWYYHNIVNDSRYLSRYEKMYFHESVVGQEQDTLFPITRAMMLHWYMRTDLQDIYDLQTQKGRLGYEGWWLSHGYLNAAPYCLSEKQKELLDEPAPGIVQDKNIPFTRAMLSCWNSRIDLQEQCDLKTQSGRRQFVAWWITAGYKESPPYRLSNELIACLREASPDIEQDAGMPISREMIMLWRSSSRLMELFHLETKHGRLQYVEWWKKYGKSIVHAEDTRPATEEAQPVIQALVVASETNIDDSINTSYIKGGVNLVGLAKGELGIGEDVRMAARAMRTAKIDFTIFNFPKRSYSRQKDESLSEYISDKLLYDVNMVNLTAFEHATLFACYGADFFNKRFTIGAWPWELPKWPRISESVYRLVDEIWASSKYAVNAYSRSPVPVVHMPMAVDFDRVPDLTRDNFKLPADRYLFLYVFDSLSYMARKNPIAHIEAFWCAFPKTNTDVGLVVKTMNADIRNDTWRKFMEMAGADERIILISDTLSKEEVLGLMNNCDAFLSLHRSEGFGRCIAEMMWLGKPVICTNFSGNVDYTTDETAFLVDGPLVVVNQGEYPFGENQYWCDPYVEQAAEHMKICSGGGEYVNSKAENGRRRIHENYSASAVAKKYIDRLTYLGII